jgi:hypothetical protein
VLSRFGVALAAVGALGPAGCASAPSWSKTRVVVSPCTPDAAPAGTLLVRVVDAAGLPMSGVIVQARVRRRMPIAEAVADANGHAALSVTPVSPDYEVIAALPGFYPTCVEDVRIIQGCTAELRLPIRVATRDPRQRRSPH